jgi:hypothetical protein
VGADLVPQYPRLPSSSPWSGDPVGLEPLIDATDCGLAFGEAVGTHAEVEASLASAAPVVTTAHDGPPEVAILPPPAERSGATSLSSTSDVAPTLSAEERLAQILPRLARPTIRRRRV